MSNELWAGPTSKLEHASFHLREMADVIQVKHDAYSVVQEHAGNFGTNWHVPFYAHVDAFLSATRSLGEVINCCFGHDPHGEMKAWFKSLDDEEKVRRDAFTKEFQKHHGAFGDLPLSKVRHVSEHRKGYPDVDVTVTGMFGVTYTGSPAKRLPQSETRQDMPSGLEWLAKARRVQPMWSDFTIDGRNLFEAFEEHRKAAQDLFNVAREIAQRVHGSNTLTPPR